MLLCRIVGYRPFIFATIRDDEGDERQRTETCWNSKGNKTEETNLLVNSKHSPGNVLPNVLTRRYVTEDRLKSIQVQRLSSNSQSIIGLNGRYSLKKDTGKDERSPSRWLHRETVQPEEIQKYSNSRKDVSASRLDSTLDCPILQKPMLARPVMHTDSPAEHFTHLPPVNTLGVGGGAAATAAAAARVRSGASTAHGVSPPATPAPSPAPAPAQAQAQAHVRSPAEHLNFQSLDDLEETALAEISRPLAEANMFSKSLPSTRIIGLLADEEKERVIKYRQLKALDHSPRLCSASVERDTIGGIETNRGFTGSSAPATLEADRPLSTSLNFVTEHSWPLADDLSINVLSSSLQDSHGRKNNHVPITPEFYSKKFKPISSPKISELNGKITNTVNKLPTTHNIPMRHMENSKLSSINTPSFSTSFHIQNISRRKGPGTNDSQAMNDCHYDPPTKSNIKSTRKRHPSMKSKNLRQSRSSQDDDPSSKNRTMSGDIPASSLSVKSYKGPFPDNLRPLSCPRNAMQQSLQLLDSPEWEKTMQGFQILLCLLKFHTMLSIAYMNSILVVLAKQVRNLRSQVSRTACMVSSELFTSVGRAVENDVDELASTLFHRSADTNKFLRADCNSALDSMLESISASRVITIIINKGARHQNAIVRTTAARLLFKIVSRLGADHVMTNSLDMRDKIILTAANFLTEGSLDTRCHAKQIFRCLKQYENFNQILQEVVPASLLRHIRKTLENLK